MNNGYMTRPEINIRLSLRNYPPLSFHLPSTLRRWEGDDTRKKVCLRAAARKQTFFRSISLPRKRGRAGVGVK
jgi:hypothetical protein